MFFSKPTRTSKGVIPLGDLKLARGNEVDSKPTFTEDAERATFITSLVNQAGFYNWKKDLEREDTYHKPVVEVEVPVYVATTEEGKHQLYIDKMMPWMQYRLFLWVLGTCGIIDRGSYIQTVQRGHSLHRLPWIKRMLPGGDSR